MRAKGWTKRPSEFPRRIPAVKIIRRKPPPPPPSYIPLFPTPRKNHLTTTTLLLLHPPNPSISDTDSESESEPETVPPCLIAIAKSNTNSTLYLYHPLTDKPLRHVSPLPNNLNLSTFDPASLTLTVYSTVPYRKLTVFPELKNPNYEECSLLGLFDGGHFWGCSPSGDWRTLSRDIKFDDIAVFKGRVYVLDRKGTVYHVKISSFYNTTLGNTLVGCPSLIDLGREDLGDDEDCDEWRKRLVVDGDVLYLVVRTEEELFKVFMREGCDWVAIEGFGDDQVLFIGRDCCFFMDVTEEFPGMEYKDCIVFCEGAFPRYGTRCWSYECEDDIVVFRLSDDVFEKECDNGDSGSFPGIDWTPPDWIFSEPEKDKEIPSFINISDSDSQDQDDERMQCDSDSEEESEEMDTNANTEGVASFQEDASPSLFGSKSESETDTLKASLSVAEEVTRTLLSLNGEKDATDEGTSRKSIPLSGPKACTSSTTKSYKGYSATTKFEGFDVRPDLVATLQKIWQKHGNITEKSIVHSGDIGARALESLATMVLILEDNSAQSLTGSQADYLRSTLSDLSCICFKVDWLVPFVQKAVKLHKRKPLLNSLNNLSQLSSQVKERRAIISDELAKLGEEENKLNEEMAKVSKMIPFSGKVKFDEPLGLGIT